MSDVQTSAPTPQSLLTKLEHEISKPIHAIETQFAPLLQKAPTMMPAAIVQVFEQAAQRIEQAGDELLQLALERVAEAKAGAAQLRDLGAQHAKSIEGAASFALESAVAFKDHLEKTKAFRADGGKGSAAHV